MKIALVFKPYDRVREPFRGGMAHYIFLMSKYLNKRGHRVEVLAGKDSKLAPGVKLFTLPNYEDSYDVYHAGYDFRARVEKEAHGLNDAVNLSFGELSARFDKKIEAYLSFFSHIRKERFDIVHAVTHDVLANYSLLFAGLPAVASFHGHYEMLGADFVRWLEFLKKNGWTKGRAFVSISKHMQKEYARYIKTEHIYNGIEVNKIKPKYKKGGHLVYLGRIDSKKGVEFAVEFSHRYQVPLLIGAIVEDKAYFEKFIKPKIDNKLVRYLGPQDEKGKIELLQNARAMIMPSHYKETLSRVIIESFAAGTPVIAFDKGANSELVTHKQTGFIIKENNLAGAYQAWQQLDQIDPKDCRKFAERHFDIEKSVENYEKLYQRLIKEAK